MFGTWPVPVYFPLSLMSSKTWWNVSPWSETWWTIFQTDAIGTYTSRLRVNNGNKEEKKNTLLCFNHLKAFFVDRGESEEGTRGGGRWKREIWEENEWSRKRGAMQRVRSSLDGKNTNLVFPWCHLSLFNSSLSSQRKYISASDSRIKFKESTRFSLFDRQTSKTIVNIKNANCTFLIWHTIWKHMGCVICLCVIHVFVSIFL